MPYSRNTNLLQLLQKAQKLRQICIRADGGVITKEISPVKEVDTIEYVTERLLKLKPVKKKSLTNSISSMFQFQGGISNIDIEKIIVELQKRKVINIANNNIIYFN